MPVTPRDAATDLLDRADGLLKLGSRRSLLLVSTDVRRMAWAMGVAAIDTYMHWAVRRTDLGMSLPKALGNTKVDFRSLVAMANDSLDARRRGIDDRPITRARNVLNDVMLTQTFQDARSVENGLVMLGVDKCWSRLSSSIKPSESPSELRDHLNRLSRRRNVIVHEGDIFRQMRPRRIRRNRLPAAEIRDELSWIRRFVDALSVVAP